MPGWAVGERKFRGRDILVFKSNRNRLLCTHHWLLHFSIEISILRPICKYTNSWAERGRRGERTAEGAVTVPAASAGSLPRSGRSIIFAWQIERALRAKKKKKKPQDFAGCLLDARLKAHLFQDERRLIFSRLHGKPRHGQKRKKRMKSFLSVVFSYGISL